MSWTHDLPVALIIIGDIEQAAGRGIARGTASAVSHLRNQIGLYRREVLLLTCTQTQSAVGNVVKHKL